MAINAEILLKMTDNEKEIAKQLNEVKISFYLKSLENFECYLSEKHLFGRVNTMIARLYYAV